MERDKKLPHGHDFETVDRKCKNCGMSLIEFYHVPVWCDQLAKSWDNKQKEDRSKE